MIGNGNTMKLLLVLSGASLIAILALLLWSDGGGHQARAYPGLTAGIDLDPSTTTDLDDDGLYETVDVTTFDTCIGFSAAPGQQFDVDFFVLDVLDLTAFTAELIYDPAVLKVVASYTGTTPSNLPTMFLSVQPLSTVQNTSDNAPDPSTGILLPEDTDGFYAAKGFDSSHTTVGDSGSGRLARITLETIAPGVSPFSIDSRDIDGDTVQDRGVLLRDVNAVNLNDANLDGFYDGPFINELNTISVGQPDLDGDTVQDPCDPDVDGDGICNPGVVDPSCTGSDNCPTIANPSQSDVDGDGLGDPCDTWDADGDGYTNATETTYVSDTLNPLSTPEVCDGADNDGDTLTDEGPFDPPTPFEDSDADTIPDCTDSDVDTDGDTIVNTSDTDDDGDGTTDVKEHVIGTDSLVACDNGSGLPDWPPDFNNSKNISILDIVQITPPVFGSMLAKKPFEYRKDLAPDGIINILDVVTMTPPVFGSSCTP